MTILNLPNVLLKIGLALAKHHIKNVIGDDALEVVATTLTDVGGEKVQAKVESIFTSKEGQRQLLKAAKAAPYLKFLSGTLGMVLPVASSAVKLALDETAYKVIEEQLNFGKSIIDATIGETAKIGEFIGLATSTTFEHGIAIRGDTTTLRDLHALLKTRDPGFGGLVRVMNKRQEFLWVHEKFASEY